MGEGWDMAHPGQVQRPACGADRDQGQDSGMELEALVENEGCRIAKGTGGFFGESPEEKGKRGAGRKGGKGLKDFLLPSARRCLFIVSCSMKNVQED